VTLPFDQAILVTQPGHPFQVATSIPPGCADRGRAPKNHPRTKNINRVCTLSNHSGESGTISAGETNMWNIRRYATIAAVGTGLVVATATSASAQCGWGFGGYPTFGAVGWGGYGGGWGSSNWPAWGYTGFGGGNWPAYGYAGYAGYGSYGGWGGWGGWPANGYASGFGWPAYGYAGGFGCHSHHRAHGYGGYALASRHYYASRNHRQPYASAHGLRYGLNHPMSHHLLASL
jgi:hypothetical protein